MAGVAFRSALQRCGFRNTLIQYFEAIALDAEILADYTGEDYSGLMAGMKYWELPNGWDVDIYENGPLIIMPQALRKLKGFQRWFVYRRMRGEDLSSADFTDALSVIWANRQATLYREVREGVADLDLKKPSALKRLKGWKFFELQLIAYLSQIRGHSSTYMVYLLRTHEIPTPEMLARGYNPAVDGDYDSIDDSMADTILFTSDGARHDNRKLYFLLNELFAEGEGKVYIKTFARSKNGRQVFLTARNAALGNASKITDIAQANAIIQTAKFTGEKRSYTFDNHLTKFQDAYLELQLNGNPVSEELQVSQFLGSITDKRMVTAKPVVLANPTMNEDLTMCAGFLQSCIASTTAEQTQASGSRNVGSVGRPEKGSGWNKKITARNYTNEEIYLFTDAEKTTLRELRAAKKSANSKGGKKKRVAKKVAVESSSEEETEEDDAPADQFGRHGDKKKKSKSSKRSKT